MPLTEAQAGAERLAYSVREFAAASGLSRSRLYEAMAAGQLQARKFGGRTIILDADARAFLEALPRRGAMRGAGQKSAA